MRVPVKFIAGLIAALTVWGYHAAAPRARSVADAPLAWWSWRTVTPAAAELEAARVQTLFLRAGQLDYQPGRGGRLQRVRAVQGPWPRGVALHLVYNATRPLLAAFEQIEPEALAATLAESFIHDQASAQCEQADIAGVQVDLDVPVRLLPRYQQVLAALRRRLPAGLKLSLTGLPAWMDAPVLGAVLAQVDFWIPQLYGAAVPHRLTQNIPLASARQVKREVRRARQLGFPFYAGLAAYGYGLLYSAQGELLELRGDLDPALVARQLELGDLELSACRPFETGSQASAWRVAYRARRECVLDGLVLRPGETLLLDVPTAANLRACANAAREQGGALLLGLCIFRLPGAADPTTLTNAELAAALGDQPTQSAAEIKLAFDGRLINVEVVNTGSASAAPKAGAMSLELRVPRGSVGGAANLAGFAAVEFWCAEPIGPAQACGPRRANVIRLLAYGWRPGMRLHAELLTTEDLPEALAATVSVGLDDGRTWQAARAVAVTRKETQ